MSSIYSIVMIFAQIFLSICSMLFSGTTATIGVFYRQISESGSNTINEDLMQQKPVVNNLFHQCSMKEPCSYVIENISNDLTTIYNTDDEIPQNKDDLRIWKKISPGEFILFH